MNQFKPRKINFIGSTTVGMTGEKADEVLIVEELRKQGQIVNFIPRDIWREHVRGENDPNWNQYLHDLKSDINIICKWHAFDEGKYIDKLKEESGAPVFYWVWDWMDGFPHGHKQMVMASDIYLANDVMHPQYHDVYHKYYFPFDVADGNIKRQDLGKEYDVVFFGSYLQQGVRKEYLKEINKHYKVKVFASNPDNWKSMGIDAESAVYGDEFAKTIAKAKICLQFSVDDNTWGYWSNRIGKTLTQGGFLLAHYAPGMELALRDGVVYFNSIEDCIEKINYYLKYATKREEIAMKGLEIGRNFTVEARIKQLLTLIENYG